VAAEHPLVPAGGLVHVVAQGENVESIAYVYGHFSATIWDHPSNRDLRTLRDDPNVLLPGDPVYVPALRERFVGGKATGRRHEFRRKGVPSLFRFRAFVCGHALAEQPYVVTVDGRDVHGTTDVEGVLQCFVRPDAARATVRIGVEPLRWTFLVSLRTVDPVSEISGVQGRLANLGLLDAPATGVVDDATRDALRGFQAAQGLEPTGEPNEDTCKRLRDVHGS
jgi:hypothetical protein